MTDILVYMLKDQKCDKSCLLTVQYMSSIGTINLSSMCSSRKNPYPPNERSLEIPRGRGVLEAKFLEAMYGNKLEFPGGRGVQNKKPSVGGVWIFSGTAQCSVKGSTLLSIWKH